MRLKGKTAIVTGACGGLGSILVKSLIKEGVQCVLIDKDKTLTQTLSQSDKAKTIFYTCDLSDLQSIENLGKKISVRFPEVEMLFNIAGVGIYKSLEDLSIKDWINAMNINLNSAFILTKQVLPSLKKSKSSVVINFGSGMGKIPTKNRVSYCSTKFGLRGMTLSLAKEFKGSNVNFCHLDLGSVMTSFGTGGLEERVNKMKNGKNYLKPEYVIKKVIKLLKKAKIEAEVTIYPPGYEV